MSRRADATSWPMNLYEKIGLRTDNLPADRNESLEYVLTNTITETEERVLRGRYQEGLTYREIGELLGVKPGNVPAILVRAFRKLQHPSREKYLLHGREAVTAEEANKQEGMHHIPIEDARIEELLLKVQVYNCLRRAHIDTVKQLLSFSRNELLQIRGLGAVSIVDLEEKLLKHNLKLREE